MTDRIEQLRAEAETAISSAPDTAALEELRVRYLGRKAELPQMLREVATLPPEERGVVGKAANQARQALEALIGTRGEQLAGAELRQQLAARFECHPPRARRHLPRPRIHRHGGP
jgi:phenylalanyl-tRNA synthetase alpha chain